MNWEYSLEGRFQIDTPDFAVIYIRWEKKAFQ